MFGVQERPHWAHGPHYTVKALVILWLMWLGNPAAAHPGWERTTQQGSFVVRFQPSADNIAIGAFEDWVLTLSTPDGGAVYPARVSIAGGMPSHGHGMPTQPQVTAYLGDGRYLVQGMKFNMHGDWRFVISVTTAHARDEVELDITLDY